MTVYEEYQSKLRTADEAVKCVKSGDWVDYNVLNGFPPALDAALARRRDELEDVKLRGNLIFGPIQVVECDPQREHFIYNSWHCSGYERKLCDKGLCNYIPMLFRNVVEYYRHFLHVNVGMVSVAPMDSHGFFNLSTSIGVAKGILETADIVIVEVNKNQPALFGSDDHIHISEVDYIVEGDNGPLVHMPLMEPKDTDVKIAEAIIPYLCDGAVLQLGIGGMPGVIGKLIAESDLKDLGMHTELASDAYLEIYKAGKLTNKNALIKGKGMSGIFCGTDEFYEWIDGNLDLTAYPLEYVNSPHVMKQIDNMFSINSCISIDLFGQISAESAGTRHISGTGGQLDYLTGASMSKGGKAFICMPSTFKTKDGGMKSSIVPTFNGDIVTDPRSQAYYIVTEYGVVNLGGRSTWERAEMLISIAHPDFREDLIKSAQQLGIWVRHNKR